MACIAYIHANMHACMHACMYMHKCKHAHMHTCKHITKHRFSQVEVMKLPKAGCLVNVPHNCVFHAATSTLRNQDGSGFYDAKRRDIAHRVFYWTHVASSPGVRTDHPGHSTGLGVNLCCCTHAIMSTHGSIMCTHTWLSNKSCKHTCMHMMQALTNMHACMQACMLLRMRRW